MNKRNVNKKEDCCWLSDKSGEETSLWRGVFDSRASIGMHFICLSYLSWQLLSSCSTFPPEGLGLPSFTLQPFLFHQQPFSESLRLKSENSHVVVEAVIDPDDKGCLETHSNQLYPWLQIRFSSPQPWTVHQDFIPSADTVSFSAQKSPLADKSALKRKKTAPPFHSAALVRTRSALASSPPPHLPLWSLLHNSHLCLACTWPRTGWSHIFVWLLSGVTKAEERGATGWWTPPSTQSLLAGAPDESVPHRLCNMSRWSAQRKTGSVARFTAAQVMKGPKSLSRSERFRDRQRHMGQTSSRTRLKGDDIKGISYIYTEIPDGINHFSSFLLSQ